MNSLVLSLLIILAHSLSSARDSFFRQSYNNTLPRSWLASPETPLKLVIWQRQVCESNVQLSLGISSATSVVGLPDIWIPWSVHSKYILDHVWKSRGRSHWQCQTWSWHYIVQRMRIISTASTFIHIHRFIKFRHYSAQAFSQTHPSYPVSYSSVHPKKQNPWRLSSPNQSLKKRLQFSRYYT